MKVILVALSMFFTAFTLTGQTIQATEIVAAKQPNNYMMSTGAAPYLEAIMITAADLKKEEGAAFGDFQILVYGQAVKLFVDPTEGPKLIAQAKELGAKLVLCEMALQKMGIAKSALPKGLDYVGNAFKHALDLQKKGYYSLSL